MKYNCKYLRVIAIAAVVLSGVLYTGCGTMMKTKNINVRSESGTAATVTIEQGGINLYSGPLPARINVSNSGALSNINPNASIRVNYTDSDGNPAVYEINKSFNWWCLGSLGGAGFAIIVDIVTGSLFTYNFSRTVVPISYNYRQPETELWVFEDIPPQMREYLVYAGNVNE